MSEAGGSSEMDEEQRMELDFCSVLLDWEDNARQENEYSGTSESNSSSDSDPQNHTWAPQHGNDNNNNDAHRINNHRTGVSLLPAFEMDAVALPDSMATDPTNASANRIQHAMAQGGPLNAPRSSYDRKQSHSAQRAGSVAATNLPTQTASSSSGSNSSTNSTTMQLHPHAIQSSAACPPHVAAMNLTQAALNTIAASALGGNALMLGSLIAPQQHADAASVPKVSSQNNGQPQDAPASSKQSASLTLPSQTLPLDASAELRANFLATQKSHEQMAHQDRNGYSHHQNYAKNPLRGDHNRRNGDSGSKRVKNAKEQRRAQLISKLIDQLREKMENDGWPVEVKSKFHTLSSCAQYVKHLKKKNEEKEESIKQTKVALKARRMRLEDEKAQQDRSEPESTTSELTESSESAPNSKQQGMDGGAADEKPRKKQRLIQEPQPSAPPSEQQTPSSEGSDRPKVGVSTVSTDQTTSSVSDVTDCIRGTKNEVATGDGGECEGGKEGNQPGKKSSGIYFELDFHEVFVRSNVPQLLAAPSGKIIAWNEFFLKVTGLKPKEVRKLTIFSLVPSRELAKLFEVVAAALRTTPVDNNFDGEAPEHDYTAITLPCVNFPRAWNNDLNTRSVYMTTTLMNHSDPRKRCFHCLFLDHPGNKEFLGAVTTDLLSLLFCDKKVASV